MVTFRVQQSRNGQVRVRNAEGVLESCGRRARQHGGVVEERGPPAVQQRVQREPVAPRLSEVRHVHSAVVLETIPYNA